MLARIHPARRGVEGRIEAPPSKSYTHRALLTALLATGESKIWNPLLSGDTIATLNAARKLGARVHRNKGYISIEGVSGSPGSPPWIYCRASGTTMRLVTAISSLGSGPTVIYGDESLNRRPMKPLIDSLTSIGVKVLSRGGYPPLAVKGPLKHASRVTINPKHSSQYVSALLLISPVAGLEINVVGSLVSRPYIDITLSVMKVFGARVEREGYRYFRPLNQGYRSVEYRVPGDYSSAAFILAAGAIAGRVFVSGLDPSDPQPDKAILGVLNSMGARVSWVDDGVLVEGGGILEPVEVDLSDSPDLAPIVAVLAAYARGTSKIRGVGHLRFKESDRVKAIVDNLSRIGVDARAYEDMIEVHGRGFVRGGVVKSYRDHRIIMAMSIAALRAESPIVVRGFERHRDSYPGFLDDLRKLGVFVEVG